MNQSGPHNSLTCRIGIVVEMAKGLHNAQALRSIVDRLKVEGEYRCETDIVLDSLAECLEETLIMSRPVSIEALAWLEDALGITDGFTQRFLRLCRMLANPEEAHIWVDDDPVLDKAFKSLRNDK